MSVFKLRGHEKFPLREGWLNKGLNGVQQDSRIFSRKDATDCLGVGSNMVKAIRYWMQAFRLLEESNKSHKELSDIGKVILKYDEYIEDIFTLWILHSLITKNKTRATVWWLFYNKCSIEEFTKEDIFQLLRKELVVYTGTERFKDTLLKDDLDVLLNMYSKSSDLADPEEKNRSPFVTLGLLKKEGKVFVKKQPEIRKISDWIVLYEITSMIGSEQYVSIEKIAGVLHTIYHLSRVNSNGMLDRLDNLGYIRVDRTAGLDMVYINKKLSVIEVLEDYYENR